MSRGGYRTGPGGPSPGEPKRCKRCRAFPCRCEPRQDLPPERHALRVRHERAGRGGKTVTVAAPLVLVRAKAEALLGELKRACGTGGTLKVADAPDGSPCFALELQGAHADRLVAELAARGYAVKRAGG